VPPTTTAASFLFVLSMGKLEVVYFIDFIYFLGFKWRICMRDGAGP
jgi:hypothetical protein